MCWPMSCQWSRPVVVSHHLFAALCLQASLLVGHLPACPSTLELSPIRCSSQSACGCCLGDCSLSVLLPQTSLLQAQPRKSTQQLTAWSPRHLCGRQVRSVLRPPSLLVCLGLKSTGEEGLLGPLSPQSGHTEGVRNTSEKEPAGGWGVLPAGPHRKASMHGECPKVEANPPAC